MTLFMKKRRLSSLWLSWCFVCLQQVILRLFNCPKRLSLDLPGGRIPILNSSPISAGRWKKQGEYGSCWIRSACRISLTRRKEN